MFIVSGEKRKYKEILARLTIKFTELRTYGRYQFESSVICAGFSAVVITLWDFEHGFYIIRMHHIHVIKFTWSYFCGQRET